MEKLILCTLVIAAFVAAISIERHRTAKIVRNLKQHFRVCLGGYGAIRSLEGSGFANSGAPRLFPVGTKHRHWKSFDLVPAKEAQ